MKSSIKSQRISTKLSILLVLALLFPSSNGIAAVGARVSPALENTSSKDRAEALLSTLTPEERVGQLFLVTFSGTSANTESLIYDLIANHHVSGVILQAGNDNLTEYPQTIPDIFQLIRQLQTDEWTASQTNQVDPLSGAEFSPAFIPLFIGISQEGDGPPYDQIINGLTPIPSQMALGATWEPDLVRQIASVSGKELSALGINLLLGPSLDVLDSPHQQGPGDLGVRTFGGDPFWVGEMGRAYISGIHEGSSDKIAVIAKNFPGHGSSDRLPEDEVATVRKSLEQLKQMELSPFFAVTGNALSSAETTDGLLVSHIRYQGFQGNIRETTRPVSLDPQAFSQLMSLPNLTNWRANGGLIISDNLGSRAFRKFIDPTGKSFNARSIARDAFLAGNDLLFIGQDFVGTDYGASSDYSTTVIRTLELFSQKYREDTAFAQRVDDSVLRILTLKFRISNDTFSLNQTLPVQSNLVNIGKSSQVVFELAQKAVTLISPTLSALAESLPDPPGLNDQIVFITDLRSAQQCSQCKEQMVMAKNALEQATIRLYGPAAGGQVVPSHLKSYSFSDLQTLLDAITPDEAGEIEQSLLNANWIVFSMVNLTTNVPTTQALSRFLTERPDLFRQKKLVVFAFNAPYFLDSTEISKITAYYGLYSKVTPFVEVAARLLFKELPNLPGFLPVSVPGISYDLISATAPDPFQTIPLSMDFPELVPLTNTQTTTPQPSPTPNFQIGDSIPVRAGVILDHNGHQVPDDTPVQFIMKAGDTIIAQNVNTKGGIARTTFLINGPGTWTIHVESDPAFQSEVLTFEILQPGGEIILPSLTPSPTPTTTLTPSPTVTNTPTVTPTPVLNRRTNMSDWLLAMIMAVFVGGIIYWLTTFSSAMRWGIRAGLSAISGGLLGYTYLALGLPGSSNLLINTGRWGVLLITVIGSCVGWAAAWSWQKIQIAMQSSQESRQ